MLCSVDYKFDILTISKGLTKVMVGVGQYNSMLTTDMEIIDLSSKSPKTCQNLANYPVEITWAFGILGLNNKPTICGGYHQGASIKDCYTYEKNFWNKISSMQSDRTHAAVSLSPYPNTPDNFFVSGGFDGNNFLTSVETLNNGTWTIQNTKTLPGPMVDHCMVLFNSTTVLAIGGGQGGFAQSGRTFFFNTQNEKWIEGPRLKYARLMHNCAMIKTSQQNKKLSVIVVGGFNNTFMSSVEILEEGSSQWRDGPNLPLATFVGMMVADSNNGVVQIGGMSPVGILDKLFHLTDANAEWIEMPQKLKKGRAYGVATLVPDNIANCS